MKTFERGKPDGRQGIALLVVLLLLGLLALLLGAFWPVAQADFLGGGEQARERTAFFSAEEGVRYVFARATADLQAGQLSMTTGTVQTVSYTPPAGAQFDGVFQIEMLNNGTAMFVVTGHCQRAQAVIEANLRRTPLLVAGVFGDMDLELQPGAGIYSYNSMITPEPSTYTSTGEADVGMNQDWKVQSNVIIDGQFLLGADANGNALTNAPPGYEYLEVGRIEPDPLGAIGGSLGVAFEYYKQALNNSNAAAGISGNKINIRNGETLTLNSGYYYLTSLNIATKGALVINSTPTAPVVIFMDGPVNAQPKQGINEGTNKSPLGLYLLSRSTQEINMQPNGEFRGLIYAPYANINFQPGDDVYGVVWGQTIVKFHPNGNVFVDVALLNQFKSNNFLLNQWRQVF